MSAGWYIRRLRRMTAAEMVRRGTDQVVKQYWRRRRVRDARRDPLPVPRTVPPWASSLSRFEPSALSATARSRLVSAADDILAGSWRVFDRLRTDMADVPDWFLDPATRRTAPAHLYAFDIDHRRTEQTGNIKYVWETSRHHHLTVLAAAYFLTRDRRYAQCAARHLSSWWGANPFLSGVHWTSGIELGVRLIAWVWVRRLLDGWNAVHELFESNPLFLQQLHHHQEFLFRLRSHGSSANNHVLAEAAGQFAACCAFPYFTNTPLWRTDAAAVLANELERQTFGCGLNRELATEYHGFVLELCIAAALEGERAGHPLGSASWRTIRRMIDALAATMDARLRPPRQGDADGGLALLLDGPGFDRWPSLLATGDALFGACPWWPAFPRTDLRTEFFKSLAKAPPLDGDRPSARPSIFPDAGMVILRDGAGVEEIWCRCDHGPHGYLAIAAHAHADALAVEVRHGGIDILADPGTYLYHGATEWRRYFRSTLGHNTLELGRTDQSVPGGDFLWMRHARTGLIQIAGADSGPEAEWHAAHDGYARLPVPARHERVVRLHRHRRRLVITDAVASSGAWPCRLAFHLGPDVKCDLSDGVARLIWQGGSGQCAASLTLPAELAWSSVRGQSNPPIGWYSPGFGEKVPTTTLLGTGRITTSTVLRTELRFDRGGDAC
jgi:hypothetical protein